MKNKTSFPYVKKNTLIFVAGIVWLIAGFNVVKLGLNAYVTKGSITIVNAVLMLLVFLAFGLMFYKMTQKHLKRIRGFAQDYKLVTNFFDLKSYLIMFVMMTFGIWLRSSGYASNDFIAFFYTGLGSALAMAGIIFIYNFFKKTN